MKSKLSEEDIRQIRDELQYRRAVLMPRLLQAVKEARAFGDLSENFEYKAAKQELNKNKRTIRDLQRLLDESDVVASFSQEGVVGLHDRVTVELPGGQRTEIRLVTALHVEAQMGQATVDSPVGRALFGRRVGETVHVQIRNDFGYDMTIVAVENGERR